MSSKVQDRIEETEKANQENDEIKKEDISEIPPDEVELSKEQLEIIDNLETKDAEEAIEHNELEERTEEKKTMPADKAEFTDEKEFSQYVSRLFYLFMIEEIDGDTFYDKLSPHFHEDFKELLPDSEENQRQTFKTFQTEFTSQISRPIKDYKVTNVESDPRTRESTFYRVYILENGERLYYMTYMKPTEEGRWLLTNDKIAPPYTLPAEIKKESLD